MTMFAAAEPASATLAKPAATSRLLLLLLLLLRASEEVLAEEGCVSFC